MTVVYNWDINTHHYLHFSDDFRSFSSMLRRYFRDQISFVAIKATVFEADYDLSQWWCEIVCSEKYVCAENTSALQVGM